MAAQKLLAGRDCASPRRRGTIGVMARLGSDTGAIRSADHKSQDRECARARWRCRSARAQFDLANMTAGSRPSDARNLSRRHHP